MCSKSTAPSYMQVSAAAAWTSWPATPPMHTKNGCACTLGGSSVAPRCAVPEGGRPALDPDVSVSLPLSVPLEGTRATTATGTPGLEWTRCLGQYSRRCTLPVTARVNRIAQLEFAAYPPARGGVGRRDNSQQPVAGSKKVHHKPARKAMRGSQSRQCMGHAVPGRMPTCVRHGNLHLMNTAATTRWQHRAPTFAVLHMPTNRLCCQ